MIAIVHSIYSQSVHALALNAGLMDNDAERYCIWALSFELYIDSFLYVLYLYGLYLLDSISYVLFL